MTSELMEALIAELKRRGVSYRTWVDEEKYLRNEHLRIYTKMGEVSVIYGSMDIGGHVSGITYGWPHLLEAAYIYEDGLSFRCLEEPEAMTVEEIIAKYVEGVEHD